MLHWNEVLSTKYLLHLIYCCLLYIKFYSLLFLISWEMFMQSMKKLSSFSLVDYGRDCHQPNFKSFSKNFHHTLYQQRAEAWIPRIHPNLHQVSDWRKWAFFSILCCNFCNASKMSSCYFVSTKLPFSQHERTNVTFYGSCTSLKKYSAASCTIFQTQSLVDLFTFHLTIE